MNDSAAIPAANVARMEALIQELEGQMPDLQLRHGTVFALANAWAERYDAIIAVTPPALQAAIEARLSRIGIRWGMMPGVRVTGEFRALDNLIPQSERLRMLVDGRLVEGMPSGSMPSGSMPSGSKQSEGVPPDSLLPRDALAPDPPPQRTAPHEATTTPALASPPLPAWNPAVTTTSQQTVLSTAELSCLLECARGTTVVDHAIAQVLVAKGMLEDADGSHVLTPAGHHALHVDQPGTVSGIDT